MLSLLSLSLLVLAAPVPVPKAPDGPAPRVEMVQVGKDGRPYLVGKRLTLVPVTKTGTSIVQEIVMVDGKPVVVAKQVPFTSVEHVPVLTQIQVPLDGKDVQVFDPSGRRLEADEVRKQLSRPVQVLVSADGKPIHPTYLQRHEGKFRVVSQALVEPKPPEPVPQPEPIPAPRPIK